jgi:selenide,water dikinase
LGPHHNGAHQALLCDPQTSGGLLVASAPESVDDVMAVFHRHGFAQAARIGRMVEGQVSIRVE